MIGADSAPKRLGGVFCMDISIPDGRDKYVVNIENYIPNADIIGAGIISRSYHGWTGLSVTYTSKEVVFTFGLDGSRAVQSTGKWKARIWYI